MARADYFALEQAICDRLANDEALVEEGIHVSVEEEVTPRRGRQVIVYLDSREAPADRQGINAGTRTRMLVRYSIMCFAWHLNFPRAMELRDDLMGRVEVALMKDPRNFGRSEVRSAWLQGGAFESARGEGASPTFMAAGEVILIADLESVL